VRAAEFDDDGGGPINVVSGTSISTRALFETLKELTGYYGDLAFAPEQPAGVSMRFDDRRLRETLGAVSSVPLRTGLAREIESFQWK